MAGAKAMQAKIGVAFGTRFRDVDQSRSRRAFGTLPACILGLRFGAVKAFISAFGDFVPKLTPFGKADPVLFFGANLFCVVDDEELNWLFTRLQS